MGFTHARQTLLLSYTLSPVVTLQNVIEWLQTQPMRTALPCGAWREAADTNKGMHLCSERILGVFAAEVTIATEALCCLPDAPF